MTRVEWPRGLLLRRKDVEAMGVSKWRFRQAVAAGKLAGTALTGHRYCKYRRDEVARAFGFRVCLVDGSAADNAFVATHADVG